MPQLNDHPITHGGIKPVIHPRLGVQVNGQTAVRLLRFGQMVRLDHLALAPGVYGRWVPNVPTHPAHLIISVLDESTATWRTVREVDLPADPRIAGEGLSQSMSVDEMNAHFARVIASPPTVIPLEGLLTDHLRVECDREHPVWPSHGECNGGELNVPFGILNTLSAHGVLRQAPRRGSGEPQDDRQAQDEHQAQDDRQAQDERQIQDDHPEFIEGRQTQANLEYRPPLAQGVIRPSAPKGMRVIERPEMLLFESERLSVGFSLVRPMLMHLGWDAHGQGRAGQNRLLVSRRAGVMSMLGGMSGPLVRTLQGDWGSHLWHGEVTVQGNRVNYRNLRAFDGLTLDAAFTVEPERLLLELRQVCMRPIPVVEAEAWRFVWDLGQGVTGAMGLPTLAPGRNGEVQLPATWATDAVGCLSMRIVDASQSPVQPRLQVESYRTFNAVTGGVVMALRPAPEASLCLPEGECKATIEWQVTALEPAALEPAAPSAANPGPGLSSRWAAVFACFRPEYGGFSNNAASVNCHVSQCAPLEVVVHTRKPTHGPDPIDLARFTVERALLDGGGYSYWRNLYMDSDSVLVSSAGRIYQARPDLGWLRRIAPGLTDAVRRMLGTIGAEGLAVCRDLSGNAGSYRWSSNSMDVVGFGHIDGYVNAWSYRAFRNASVMLRRLGDGSTGSPGALASRAHDAAEGIRANYARVLLNPRTGWVAGWRSRDGELHDYAFIYVNGIAIALGLLDVDTSRRALTALEALRAKVGLPTAQLGLPCNLLPIRREDHMLPLIFGDFAPTFETYTDGSMSGWPATYYLRALSIYGMRAQAQKLAQELDAGYAAGIFDGGIGTGHEFRSWEGLPTGYEGTLIGCFAPLYAVAIEQGILSPPQPEWWPADDAL